MKNIIVTDFDTLEDWPFRRGIEKVSNEEWSILSFPNNKVKKGWGDLQRYLKYFTIPYEIFKKRKEYKNIVFWQTFYGVVFAFYCKLFGVKKVNKSAIMHIVYNPKKGLIGKLYYKWLKYSTNNKYVDLFICPSQRNCNYLSDTLDISNSKFVFSPLGIEPISQDGIINGDYYLAAGRSNRDYSWLIDSFNGINQKLIIINDQLKEYNDDNIQIKDNVWKADYIKYLKECKGVILPIDDPNVDSGFLVLLQAMACKKPVIITKPSCIADDYLDNMVNGIIINKNKDELVEALTMLSLDNDFYNKICSNAYNTYINKYSLEAYGANVGKAIIS